MHRVYRWLLLVLLVQLTACSSTTFFYNRLHFLVPWYLGGYVDLEQPQRQYLDELLATFLHQHRREELPRYVDILSQATAMLDREIAVADLAALYSEAEQAADRLQAGALEWLLALGAELSDEQIRGLITELRDRQEEYRDQYLARDDRQYRSDAYDSLRKNARKYLGRLDSSQREQLQRASGELKRSDGAWLESRQAWIDYLEQILQRQPGWQRQLREAMAERAERNSPEYREAFGHNLAVIQAALADLLNSRSERQDRHLRRELQKLQSELHKLAGQGGAYIPAQES